MEFSGRQWTISRHLVHVSSCRSHPGMMKCQLSP